MSKKTLKVWLKNKKDRDVLRKGKYVLEEEKCTLRNDKVKMLE